MSAQGPLVSGFWVLGLRVWGQGLTIIQNLKAVQKKTPVSVLGLEALSNLSEM